jgi:hypothetical protein
MHGSNKHYEAFACLPAKAFFPHDVVDATESRLRERWDRSLHSNLYGFEGAQAHISNQFSGCTTCEIDSRFILVEVLLPYKVAVELLEELVATILETSLS